MMMSDEERYEEYLICQRRGHQPGSYMTTGIPPKTRCRWCGTLYWIESLVRESGVPEVKDPKTKLGTEPEARSLFPPPPPKPRVEKEPAIEHRGI